MKSNKTTTLIVISLLVLTAIASAAALRSNGQNNSASTRQEEATVIQEGVMTEKQKQHSKLYKKEYENLKNKRIRDLISSGASDRLVIGVGAKVDMPNASPFNLDGFLKGLACEADAVVIGSVKSKTSQLTEEGTFIFTDYEFAVEETLKQNSNTPIQDDSEITISRAGGTIQLNGKKFQAVDEYALPLETGGRYLLFLRFIPATGAYQVSGKFFEGLGFGGGFQLRGEQFVKLTKESLPSPLEGGNDAAALVSRVRAAAACTCENLKGGISQ